MLHVIVDTVDTGKRKAWYIETVQIVPGQRPTAIVVYKNNSDYGFEPVEVSRVHLDVAYRNDVSAVPDGGVNSLSGTNGSLRSINMKLKKKKEPMVFNSPMLCNKCGRCHKTSEPCIKNTLPFKGAKR